MMYSVDPPEDDTEHAYCPACGETEAWDHDGDGTYLRCTTCGMRCEHSDEDALEAARDLCDRMPSAALELLARVERWAEAGTIVTEAAALHGLRPELQGERALLDGILVLARRIGVVAGLQHSNTAKAAGRLGDPDAWVREVSS